jgi:hypothetical protein
VGRVGQEGIGVLARVAHTLAYQQSSAIVPQAGPEARALLDKVIAAKGGLETLRGVKTITARTRTEMPAPPTGRGGLRPASAAAIETVTYLEYPNRAHIETRLPDATVVQVYDGARAWVKDPNGLHDVPEQMVQELRLGLRRDTIAALLAAYDGRLRARILPDVKVEGGKIHHALELSAHDLDPLVLYIDPESHLVARQTYVAGGAGQPLVEELFSDYKPVDGVQIAFTATVRRGQQTVIERKVVDLRINDPLDPALFRRPQN